MKITTTFIALSTVLTLTAGPILATGSDHMTHTKMDRAMGQVADLALSNGFVFATLPNQPVGAGFVTFENTGSAPDRLIAASSPMAGKVEIHSMSMNDGVMKMRELDNGLEIPTGETVAMEPGGYHLMFMQLNRAFTTGELVHVTLTFEQAGDIEIMLPIENRMAGGHNKHGTN